MILTDKGVQVQITQYDRREMLCTVVDTHGHFRAVPVARLKATGGQSELVMVLRNAPKPVEDGPERRTGRRMRVGRGRGAAAAAEGEAVVSESETASETAATENAAVDKPQLSS